MILNLNKIQKYKKINYKLNIQFINLNIKFDNIHNLIILKNKNGQVFIKINKNIKIFKNINSNYIKLYFLKKYFYLLKSLFKIFKNSIKGLLYGYKIVLELFGLGYKIIYSKCSINFILLDLGFSHRILYKLNKNIFLLLKGKYIIIYGLNKYDINNTAFELRNIRILNKYKPKGIKYINEKLNIKKIIKK
jgi:large subunit ribosomal protein L6